MKGGDERRMTFVVVPHRGEDLSTRSYEVSYRRLRIVALLLLVAVGFWIVMAVSWWFVAAQAAQVPFLKREIRVLEQRQDSVRLLAQKITEMERFYEQIRTMLGAEAEGPPGESLPLPPLPRETGDSGDVDSGDVDSTRASLPASWPLRHGFVTREHAFPAGPHPGIDIAVPRGSEIRAAARGIVEYTGEDSVYGKFVRIRHTDGYQSIYAHASRLLVSVADSVRRDEVIALSGNSGASTGPHLHFEVRKNGTPINPRMLTGPVAGLVSTTSQPR